MSRVGGLREAPLEGNPPTQRGVPRAGCLLGLGGGGEKWGCAKTPLLAGCPLWALGIERRTSRCVGRTGKVEGSCGAKGLTVADPK